MAKSGSLPNCICKIQKNLILPPKAIQNHIQTATHKRNEKNIEITTSEDLFLNVFLLKTFKEKMLIYNIMKCYLTKTPEYYKKYHQEHYNNLHKKIICDVCGGSYNSYTKASHMRTKKHKLGTKVQNNEELFHMINELQKQVYELKQND